VVSDKATILTPFLEEGARILRCEDRKRHPPCINMVLGNVLDHKSSIRLDQIEGKLKRVQICQTRMQSVVDNQIKAVLFKSIRQQGEAIDIQLINVISRDSFFPKTGSDG